MNLLKSLFLSAFVTMAFVLTGWSVWAMVQGGFDWGWLGVALTALPPALLVAWGYAFTSHARTSANLPVAMGSVLAGLGLAIWSFVDEGRALPLGLAVAAGMSFFVYDFWYSRLGRGPSHIEVGKRLPAFRLKSSTGEAVDSKALEGAPALLMFYRGNWCPLCMAQIKEVAANYRGLAERGVAVWMIAPQPQSHTASLAAKFDVPFRFLVDEGNAAARALGIAHAHGVPAGLQVLGYDSETVLPTVVITDAGGKVIWSHETDNYRVRPEPETFIEVLDRHQVA